MKWCIILCKWDEVGNWGYPQFPAKNLKHEARSTKQIKNSKLSKTSFYFEHSDLDIVSDLEIRISDLHKISRIKFYVDRRIRTHT